jgi:hypothetical protein
MQPLAAGCDFNAAKKQIETLLHRRPAPRIKRPAAERKPTTAPVRRTLLGNRATAVPLLQGRRR